MSCRQTEYYYFAWTGLRLARASIFHVKRFHVNEVYNKVKEHTFLCQFV